MCRKLVLLISLVAVLGLTGVSGAAIVWDNSSGNGLWVDANNWHNDGDPNKDPYLPTTDDNVEIGPNGGDPNLSASITDCNLFVGPGDAAEGREVEWMNNAAAGQYASFTMTGGTITNGDNHRSLRDASGGLMELFISGGVCTWDDVLDIGDDADPSAQTNVFISGDAQWLNNGFRIRQSGYLELKDTAVIEGQVRLGDNGVGVVRISGGTVRNSTFRAGDNDDGLADVIVTGGTFENMNEIFIGDDGGGFMKFSNVTLPINGRLQFSGRGGDRDGLFEFDNCAVSSGNIAMGNDGDFSGTATWNIYGSTYNVQNDVELGNDNLSGTVNVDFNGGLITCGSLRMWGNTWIDINDVNADMAWIEAGNDASADVQAAIDEGRLTYNITKAGNVWRFVSSATTTYFGILPAGQTYGLSPKDGSTNLGMPTEVSWNTGDGVSSVILWYGTSEAGVTDSNALDPNVTSVDVSSVESYSMNTAPSNTYYWKIVSDGVESNVMSFSTASGKATGGTPQGTYSKLGNVTLSWTKGSTVWVDKQTLYYGTSQTGVADGNSLDPNVTTVALTTESSKVVPAVPLGTRIYWKVDTESVANGWFIPGTVWNYVMNNDRYIIEDFQSYGDTTALRAVWIDSVASGNPNNGATAALSTNPARGGRAMSVDYFLDSDYGPYVATVTRSFSPAVDLTSSGVRTLAVWYYGDDTVGEYLEKLSITLNGSDTASMDVTVDDPALAEWQQINIDLDDFASVTSVSSMAVDFVDTGIYAAAKVYVDDITLEKRRCVAKMSGLVGDITGNCVVDGGDLNALENDWTKFGEGTILASPADGTKLVVDYEFDDTTGVGATQVIDSVAGNDANYFVTLDRAGTLIDPRIEAGGKSGTCFNFPNDGDHGLDIPAAVWTGFTDEVTISVWIKNTHPEEEPDGGAFMMEFRQWDGVDDGGGDRVIGIETDNNGDRLVWEDDDENVEHDRNWVDDFTDWVHYAFVRDASSLKMYVNGILVEEGGSSGNTLNTPGLLYLGISADRSPTSSDPTNTHDAFTGTLDQFKMYSYALSQGEVLDAAGVASVYDAVDSNYDLVEDNVINFKDYDVIADDWMKEVLFPATP